MKILVLLNQNHRHREDIYTTSEQWTRRKILFKSIHNVIKFDKNMIMSKISFFSIIDDKNKKFSHDTTHILKLPLKK